MSIMACYITCGLQKNIKISSFATISKRAAALYTSWEKRIIFFNWPVDFQTM
jgi:hypothetical protein